MARFLIVDDDDMSRMMLKEFLSDFAVCHLAPNGKEGLSLFEKALNDGTPYDLICVDILMPEMNGLALVRAIRELEKAHPLFSDFRTRLFVISASDSPWDRADFMLDNLCDDYIVKPFDREKLIALLTKYVLVSVGSSDKR